MLPQNDNKFNYGGHGCLSTRNCSSTCDSRRVVGILSVMCLFVMRFRTHILTNNVLVVFVSRVNSSVDVPCYDVTGLSFVCSHRISVQMTTSGI